MNRCRLALVASIAALSVWTAGWSQPAGAQVHDGACVDADGVTVVVDFQSLGGGIAVRCAPWSPGLTGFGALQAAGIQYQTAVRFPGFLCKIAGRPAEDRCIDTSPATAYWSYWLASRGGQWCYSNWGAGNRQSVPGSVEAWSFSSQQTPSGATPPRLAAPSPVAGAPSRPLAGDDCDPSRSTAPPPAVAPTVPAAPGTPLPPSSPPVPPNAGGGLATSDPHGGGDARTTGGAADPNVPHVASAGGDTGSDVAPGASSEPPDGDAADTTGDAASDADSTPPVGSAEDAEVHGERSGARASQEELTVGSIDLSGGDRTSSPTGVIIAATGVVVLSGLALRRARQRAVDRG